MFATEVGAAFAAVRVKASAAVIRMAEAIVILRMGKVLRDLNKDFFKHSWDSSLIISASPRSSSACQTIINEKALK